MSVKLTIDTTVNAAYVQITEEKIAETVPAGSGIMIDLDSEGRVVGVEVLNVKADIPLAALAERFALPHEALDYLRQVSSTSAFDFGRFSQTTDGTSARQGIPALA